MFRERKFSTNASSAKLQLGLIQGGRVRGTFHVSRKLYFGVERRRSDGNNRFSTYRMKMGQLAVTGTAAVDNYRKREFSKGLSFS